MSKVTHAHRPTARKGHSLRADPGPLTSTLKLHSQLADARGAARTPADTVPPGFRCRREDAASREEGEPQASQVTPLGRRMVRSDRAVHRAVNWTGK